MLRWLKPLDAKHVMFEATDCHHRTLERRLSEACVPFAKVNPCRTRRFAEATGRLAKTDWVDAAMLASFIWGVRAHLRRALYMTALVALRSILQSQVRSHDQGRQTTEAVWTHRSVLPFR